MKRISMKKMLALIGCIVLIAAMALMTTGCGSKEPAPAQADQPAATSDVTVLGEGATVFAFCVKDLEGNETKFEIHPDETTVGAALIGVGLLEGEDGPYGLYVKKVNGISAVYEEDGTYWAFYENDEYAMAGVDQTDISPDTAYAMVQTKG